MSVGRGASWGPVAVPAGFRAVALWAGEEGATLRVCVVVRDKEHAGHGRLVRLREAVDCRTVLGCVTDSAGQVREWVEIDIQDLTGLESAPAVYREAASAEAMDGRWKENARGMRAAGGTIACKWEGEHPPAALEVDGGGGAKIAVNPGRGLMMIRSRGAAGYEEVVEALSADPSNAALPLGPLPAADAAAAGQSLRLLGDEGFLSAPKGVAARAAEVLYLKLRLLADAVEAARAMTEKTSRPLLNLSAESFRVELGAPSEGLPLLWTARAVLATAGEAAVLPVPGAEAEYYVRAASSASVYAPESAGRAVQGRASLRIRKVENAGAHGAVIVTGTFSTQERLKPSPSDLTWVRVQAGGERVDLYARLEADPALAAGEWRFRTVPQRFGDAAKKGLQAAEGVVTSEAPFQVVPLLSTPCDLYALGVLGVRTLLVGGGNTLGEALDEVFSLARNAGSEAAGGADAVGAVKKVLKSDARWGAAIGPQRVAHGMATVAAGLEAVPLDLWCGVLSVLARMFAGLPGAYCRDLGDAPGAGLHSVFDAPARDLAALVRRARSLVVVDWGANREIHAVVRARRTGMTGSAGGAGGAGGAGARPRAGASA